MIQCAHLQALEKRRFRIALIRLHHRFKLPVRILLDHLMLPGVTANGVYRCDYHVNR